MRLSHGYLALNMPDEASNVYIFYVGLRIRGYRLRILAGTFYRPLRTCGHKFRLWRPGHHQFGPIPKFPRFLVWKASPGRQLKRKVTPLEDNLA